LRNDQWSLTACERIDLTRFGANCRSGTDALHRAQGFLDRILPRPDAPQTESETLDALLSRFGFDRVQHERVQSDMRAGRIGLAQNRLPHSIDIRDVSRDEIGDATTPAFDDQYRRIGEDALRAGAVAVITLSGGVASRWTRGAGVVKGLVPFHRSAGRFRTFVEVHLAKSRKAGLQYGCSVPHVFTTSYLTHHPLKQHLDREQNYGYPGPLHLSPGRMIGLRMIPMVRDLRFAWEEMPQQILDDQAQKLRESVRAALVNWVEQMGEGADYTDNLPLQCLHPVGHWYEVANLFRNGVLRDLLEARPGLRYLLLHNLDTLGAHLDSALLGWHIARGATMTVEVITRRMEDRGGGLANVNGHLRLLEGMALPADDIEFQLSWYNSNTFWIDIDALLAAFALTRTDLGDEQKVTAAVRAMASRMPAYITIKDVKKRWGKGQEDVYPVAQFEKLWGDMTALPHIRCEYVVVSRMRGQQLKEPAQLDGWLRDGSAQYVDSLCDFAGPTRA
jgi:hypothetical protein